MSKVPGTPGPVPPGGVLLNTPLPPPQTEHRITFHGCSFGLYVLLDEDNVCKGYKLVIQDPRNASTYEADFGQELIDSWMKDLQSFPRVGQKPEGIDESI